MQDTNNLEVMKMYIGTKLINAEPMSRQEYNDFRGWKLQSDEDGSDKGFLVEYLDGGTANTDEYDGYVSWSPEGVFNNSYKSTDEMTFGSAIVALKAGLKIARAGWNGKGMFLFLVPGSNFKVNRPPLLGIYEEGTEINYCPHIDMKTADDKVVPWLASQTDVLAEDWVIVE